MNAKEVRTILVGPVVMAMVIIGVLTGIGTIQANQYRGIVEKLDLQEQTIICILEIVPTDRTPQLIMNCVHDPHI